MNTAEVIDIESPGNAVAQPQARQIATASNADSLFTSIVIAAENGADVDRIEKLMALYERVKANDARAQFVAAMSKMQPKIPAIRERGGIRDRTGNVQSTYALWEDINETIKPILAAHGFALTFRTTDEMVGENLMIVVTGSLSHEAGHVENTTMRLPIDASGSKNNVQARGSSVSYGKRYTASALLNLTSHGEDDDGKTAGADIITEEQVIQLRDMIEAVEADPEKFLKYLGVQSIAAIPAKKFDAALNALKAKQRRAE